jgi:hypothetical protein
VTLAANIIVPPMCFLSLVLRERGWQVLVWSYSCESLRRTAFARAEIVLTLVHLLLVRVYAPKVFLHGTARRSWVILKSMTRVLVIMKLISAFG